MLNKKSNRSIPIFIIGKHRSGTTGLANHLCEHPDIAGVQHKQHWGIHESGYFTYVAGRYGSLNTWPNFREFVGVMSESDYFRIAGISKEYMLSLWPTTYADFFEEVMDEFASRRGTQFWLEKSPGHTKEALRLAAVYPNARFIAIVRNVEDVVASSLSLENWQSAGQSSTGKIKALAKVALGWIYYLKCIRQMERRFSDRTLVIQYEHFRQDKRKVLEAVCSFLGVQYERGMVKSPYAHNTSFDDQKKRSRSLTEGEKRLLQWVTTVFDCIPYRVYRALDVCSECIRGKPSLPDWFFKISDRKCQQ
jgi:hypothetical protein